MKYRDIINDIKSKNLKNIYFLYGREYYLIDNAIKNFKESLNESMIDFNLDVIDGKEVTLEQILSSIETLPFMDDKKITIVKDFELLKGKRKNFSEGDEKYFIDYLDNISESTTLVFAVSGDIDKRKKIVKKIQEKGVVFNCDKISDMDLFKWTKKKFESFNVIIENAQVMYFIESQGYRDKNSEKTLSDLQNEIIKMSSFVGEGNKIDNEVIDKLSQKKIENDIFKLIDYIGEKNSSSAIKILNDMIEEGESVLGIFVMISRQFKTVLQVKELQLQGSSINDICKRLNIKQFIVNKAIKQNRNFSYDKIIDMLNFILENDFKIKNGLIKDTLAIEMLISKYCQKDIK